MNAQFTPLMEVPMLYAILTILSFAIQNLCCKEYGRRFEDRIPLQAAMIVVSTLIVAGIMLVLGGFKPLLSGEWGIAVAFGFWFVVTLASMTLAMSYGHMGITLLIQNSSLMVPTLYSALVWHERFTVLKGLGTACILAMLALSALDGGDTTDAAARRRWNRKLWAIFTGLAFIGDSVLGILQGYMAMGSTDSVTFTLWTSLFSASFAAVLLAATAAGRRGSLSPVRDRPRAFMLCCAGIGAGTAGGNAFSILALAALPGIVLYPLRQGGLVLLLWIVGVLFYHEKVNRQGWLMLVLGLAGIVMLSM